MAKVTATQVLDLARSQIGVKATNYRKCKYNTWYYGAEVSGSWYHWCETFIQWIFNELKASSLLYTKTANVGIQAQAFEKKGRLVKSDYKAGDLVIFSWSGDASSWIKGVKTLDHIGIIEKVNADGTYTTIEGNTGSSNNGEVMRRTRYAYQISCCLRPNYKTEKVKKRVETVKVTMQVISKDNSSNDKGQVRTLQRILNGANGNKGYRDKDGKKLKVDGSFGENTEYALKEYQKKHNLTADGICGQKTWNALLCAV